MNYRILILVLSLLVASCVTVEVCEEEYASYLVARFKTVKEGVAADTTVNALSLYGIREGKNDSLLYNGLPASGFLVPLDPNQGLSSFVLQIDTLTDTLHVYYEHEVYLISYTCGFASLFTLEQLDTGSGVIQKDTILNDLIDAQYDENEAHIWLYL